MGIKVLNSAPCGNRNTSNKFDLFAADIMEIITNEVEFCEFTDFPYSKNTTPQSLKRKIDRVFKNEFQRKTGEYKDIRAPFIINRVKDDDGTVHFYGIFSVTRWKKMIQEAMNEEDC